MKIQVSHLCKKHLKKLRRLQRHRLTIVSRRATILILSYQGWSCSQIAGIVGLHVQTVRNWIKAFNTDRKERWDLFEPKPHPGRKPIFDEKVQQGLLNIFKESPPQVRLHRKQCLRQSVDLAPAGRSGRAHRAGLFHQSRKRAPSDQQVQA